MFDRVMITLQYLQDQSNVFQDVKFKKFLRCQSSDWFLYERNRKKEKRKYTLYLGS